MREETGSSYKREVGSLLGVSCLEWERFQAAIVCEKFKRERKIKKEIFSDIEL